MNEEAERAGEPVVVTKVIDPVVIVQARPQLRVQLFPIRVGDPEGRGADFLEATNEPPPVGRKMWRKEDDVQFRAIWLAPTRQRV